MGPENARSYREGNADSGAMLGVEVAPLCRCERKYAGDMEEHEELRSAGLARHRPSPLRQQRVTEKKSFLVPWAGDTSIR